MTTRTLYLIACAAPPARRLHVPVRAAQEAGWDVCVILTPAAYRWATEDSEGEIEVLQELTGHPVRWQYKLPSQPDALPAPDAILVAPLTNNTLAKWATAISDTLAFGLITEGIGLGLPIVALPHAPSPATSPSCAKQASPC
ncbi:flavoprotein [Streptomyces atratus]